MATVEGAAGGGAEETTSSSPRNRVKFLCTHGGKILPRPVDGQLKYVGGETRVVAVPRDIKYPELMQKLSALFDGDTVLKYQIIPEELDALVSVRSDEDLRHMLDEYDRQESEGTPKLRAFLFPSNPIVLENQASPAEPHALEQRYIDAINGIVRLKALARRISINTNRPTFSISACSSPKSLSPDGPEGANHERAMLGGGYQSNRMMPMHKVRSSPSLCSLANNPSLYPPSTPGPSLNHSNHQLPHQNHYIQNHRQHHQQQGYQFSRPPDPHKSFGERVVTVPPVGRMDSWRSQVGHGPSHHYSSGWSQRGYGGCNTCGHVNEYYCNAYGCRRIDRADSLPHSPVKGVWE